MVILILQTCKQIIEIKEFSFIRVLWMQIKFECRYNFKGMFFLLCCINGGLVSHLTLNCTTVTNNPQSWWLALHKGLFLTCMISAVGWSWLCPMSSIFQGKILIWKLITKEITLRKQKVKIWKIKLRYEKDWLTGYNINLINVPGEQDRGNGREEMFEEMIIEHFPEWR